MTEEQKVRRHYTTEQKVALLDEADQPGQSVAVVARKAASAGISKRPPRCWTSTSKRSEAFARALTARPAYRPTFAGQNCWKNLAIAPDAKLGMAWGSPGLTHQTTGYPGMHPWYSTQGEGSTGLVSALQPLYLTSESMIGWAKVIGRAVSASP